MAVRTGYVGTQSAGDVLTSANFTKLPGGLIGYAIVTANQTGIATGPTDLTSLTVTVTVGTNRMIRIEGFGIMQQQTSSGNCNMSIRESATTLAQANGTIGASAYFSPHPVAVLAAPSSGSHTYKLSAGTDTATINLLAAATNPAVIMVFDDGPSF